MSRVTVLGTTDEERQQRREANYDRVSRLLGNVLTELRKAKPEDRSTADRVYAVVITDVQKAKAFFDLYADPAWSTDHDSSTE